MGCAPSHRKYMKKRKELFQNPDCTDSRIDCEDFSPFHLKEVPHTFDNDESPLYHIKFENVCKDTCVLSVIASCLQPGEVSTTVTIWVSPTFHHFQLLPFSRHSSIHIPRPVPMLLNAILFFKHLTDLTLGCYGLSANVTIDDDDIEIILTALGQQLSSLSLIKLHKITLTTFQNIFMLCGNIARVTYFNCEAARHEPCTTLSVMSSSLGDIKLELLDIRFSIELSDVFLNEIITLFSAIDM